MKKGHFASRSIEPLKKLSNIEKKSVIGQEIGQAYEYISIAFHSKGYFRKAIEYQEKHLKLQRKSVIVQEKKKDTKISLMLTSH